MNITHDKYKDELSKFYRLGYATNYRDMMECIKKFLDEVPDVEGQKLMAKLIQRLGNYYMSYPCAPKIEEINNGNE